MNLHGCKLPLFLGEHEPNDETINAFLQHAGYHTEERYWSKVQGFWLL